MHRLTRILLFTVLLCATGLPAGAQEPPAEPAAQEPSAQETPPARIVEGRPALYSVKRAIHPLTWLEAATEPLFRSAENGRIHNLAMRKPDPDKGSGVRFGIGAAGTSSGLGPLVTFFHKDLLGHRIDVEVPLLYTYSRYELYQFKASVPLLTESTFVDRLSFDIGSAYSSRTRDDFFGIGNDTPQRDEAQFRTVSRQATAGLTAKLSDAWSSGLHAGYRNVGVTKPLVGQSAQDRFDSVSTPGLFSGATLRSLAFALVRNTETKDQYQFKGSRDELEVSFNDSAGKGNFTYWKYRLDLEHFFPLTSDGRKVIAARGLVETNHANAGSNVPFFDMPALGSFSTLRGFENFRFRDKSAMAAGIEYRYRIWPAMDWGLFLDEGQVAPQLGNLSLNRFHTGYGVRLFVWPKHDLPISFDYGRSKETWRLYINLNTTF